MASSYLPWALRARPDDVIGDGIVEDLRMRNFIPEDAENLYKEAFLREYQTYCETKKR
jgi:hypothetical protein